MDTAPDKTLFQQAEDQLMSLYAAQIGKARGNNTNGQVTLAAVPPVSGVAFVELAFIQHLKKTGGEAVLKFFKDALAVIGQGRTHKNPLFFGF